MSSSLNMTNAQRLKRYPDGKCPLCGGHHYSYYWTPEEDEHGLRCDDCGEEFRYDDDPPTKLLDEFDHYIA